MFFIELLYKPPEFLRNPVGYLTQKGDVYSFGIILEEIVLRGGPFEEASMEYTPNGKY